MLFKAHLYFCSDCLSLKYKRCLFIFYLICFHNTPNLNNFRIILMFQSNIYSYTVHLICQIMSYIHSQLHLFKKYLWLYCWYSWHIHLQSFLTQYFIILLFSLSMTVYFNLWTYSLFCHLKLNYDQSHKYYPCYSSNFLCRFLNVKSSVIIFYRYLLRNHLNTCSMITFLTARWYKPLQNFPVYLKHPIIPPPFWIPSSSLNPLFNV